MKKLLLIFSFMSCVCFAYSHETQANEKVDLHVGIFDPTTGNECPRAPMQPPHVFIDGHTLLMQYVPFDVTLEILDGSGSVVYTTFVAAYTPSVTLPTTLSGDYQIRLIEGYWFFYGWIHL